MFSMRYGIQEQEHISLQADLSRFNPRGWREAARAEARTLEIQLYATS